MPSRLCVNTARSRDYTWQYAGYCVAILGADTDMILYLDTGDNINHYHKSTNNRYTHGI